MPISAYTNPGDFKIYMSGVGMLTMKSGSDTGFNMQWFSIVLLEK